MSHMFLPSRRYFSGLVAACAILVLQPAGASALAVKITSITATPGSGGFVPNDRLGLGQSQLGTAATNTGTGTNTGTSTTTVVEHKINRADCIAIKSATSALVRITWSWSDYTSLVAQSLAGGGATIIGAPEYAIKVAPPGVTCSDNELDLASGNAGCLLLKSKRSFASKLTENEIADVDLKALLGGTSCSTNAESKASIYFIMDDPKIATIQPAGVAFDVTIDTQPPTMPTLDSVSSGNANLKVSWTTADAATTKYSRVYWSKIAFPASTPTQATNRSALLTGSSYQITGLTNGDIYFIAVTSLDDLENESAAEKVAQASPVPVQDFWQSYKANGGAAEGGYYGCSAQPNSSGTPQNTVAWLLLLVVGILALRRWRDAATVLLLLIVAITLTAPKQSFAESPRTMSLDLRGTYYSPMIDREFSTTTGATPYASMMTNPAMQYGASLDWRLWYGFGELCLGMSVGYWSQTGKALRMDGSKSDDNSTLLVVPLTLDLVYRFNWLAEEFTFPLVPYVKGGLAYGLWWASDGVGETSTFTGADSKVYNGSGGVAGFHVTVGMRLLLDVFEPKAARGFDIEMGVNHSYLFIEYQRLSLTNFGDPKALDLSDDVISVGIAFDL